MSNIFKNNEIKATALRNAANILDEEVAKSKKRKTISQSDRRYADLIARIILGRIKPEAAKKKI